LKTKPEPDQNQPYFFSNPTLFFKKSNVTFQKKYMYKMFADHGVWGEITPWFWANYGVIGGQTGRG
jgi:hypothetical protein